MGFISKLFVIYGIGCEEFVFDLIYMNHALIGEKISEWKLCLDGMKMKGEKGHK